MPRLISIGNSFSTDAQRYLHKLTVLTNDPFSTANLYISDCTLKMHAENIVAKNNAYSYEYNGETTGIQVSLQNAFENTNYSIITIQQQSLLSTDINTFQPYLNHILNYLHEKQPNAQIYLHETWPYQKDSEILQSTPFLTSWEMYQKVKSSYATIAKETGLKIIPCGAAIMNALMLNLPIPMHRDGCHASSTYGCYLLALTWLLTITGKIPEKYVLPSFTDGSVPDKKICDKLLDCAIKAVRDTGIAFHN